MSERLNDYFAKEAGEYLDQLERLLDLPGEPDADHLLRLATGVRGSAQMAQAETVAGVAERLEDAARAMLTHDVAWSDELRSLAARTVADLKLLVRALNRWGPEEEERVRIALSRWDQDDAGGEASEPLPMLVADETAGVVPIASLFFDDAGPHVLDHGEGVTDAPKAVPTTPGAPRAVPQSGAPLGSADELMTLPGSETTSPPVGSAGPDSSPPLSEASPSADQIQTTFSRPASAGSSTPSGEVVPIEDLLLRGESALLEAIALRPTFESFARGDAVPDRSLADVVQELFDLVEQGITPDRPEA